MGVCVKWMPPPLQMNKKQSIRKSVKWKIRQKINNIKNKMEEEISKNSLYAERNRKNMI